ncbi:intraflagellar transport-associated protein isoform X2 [Bufo bufo]|nr:intraflagellar transport-associated protein isoform X2 [Bufo bufo]XP_040266149.1 intraflagellar transport-associated protein isoform X2 [Bufo bufo]
MPSPDVAEEGMANSVLTRFIGIPEQTYEEFLSTFTCLPQGARRQLPEVMSDGSQIQKVQTTHGTQDTTDVDHEQDEPEQLTIGEGTTAGHFHSLTYSGRVQVDNYFNSSDIDPDSDNDETSPSVVLFPGEADLALAAGNEPIVRETCVQNRASSAAESAAEEHLGDDIQPFSLDQSFDYDRVVLTSKLSAEEMNFLKLRGPQKAEETGMARET